MTRGQRGSALDIPDLSDLIPECEWNLQREVITGAREQGLPFALGGGLAFSAYSGRWRNTKDVDLFVRPEDRHAFVDLLGACGFDDYYARLEYDRSWIYRGYRDDVILDIIWTMPNHRFAVDADWLNRGIELRIHGDRVSALPLEELLCSKLYVMQHDRCDWPDLLNLLYAQSRNMDWKHLIGRMREDTPLLGGLLSLFGWLCPAQAARIPKWVWGAVGLTQPAFSPVCDEDGQRAHLLDTRDWFGPRSK